MTIFEERRKKVLARAKGRKVVAATGANVFYLTDFCGAAHAIVLPDRTVLVTSKMEGNRARAEGHEVEVIAVGRGTEARAAVLKELGRGEVVTDEAAGLGSSSRFKASPELFLSARRVKDEVEIARITAASKVLDKIFRVLEKEIRPGRTEWQIAAEVMRVAIENETTPISDDLTLSPTIIASGEHAAFPHVELSSRKVKKGEFLLADIFFRYKGYNSDATRTFAVGTVSGEMKRNYGVVLEAQAAAMAAIRTGAVCGDVNEAAVSVLRKHKLDRYLTHSIGHGVGVDIHEMPGIFKGNPAKLLMNDVVTDEPGVYFKGRYGIRIEDTVVVDAKPKLLTRYTKELVSVG